MSKIFEFRWENEHASIVLTNPDYEVISPSRDLTKLTEEYCHARDELWHAFLQAREKLTKPDTSRFRGKPLGAEYYAKWRMGNEAPPQDTGK
jgi:hypothetical protein